MSATVLDVTPEEQPHQRQKNGRPLAKLLKEGCQEAFSKDTEIIKAARWAYHPSHKGMFTQEGSHDLTSIFREMAQETNLLNAEIHEVQEVLGWWVGTESCQMCCKSLPKGNTIFLHSIANQVTQHHGVEGDSLP